MASFQENIDSSSVLNRKLIVELRFKPIPTFLDKKGEILSKMAEFIPNGFWSFGELAVKISDNNMENHVRTSLAVEINRFAYVSTKIDSIQKYVDDIDAMYKALELVFPDMRIVRIGCRIQGTYKTASRKFDNIVENFKKSFPNNIFFDGFQLKDLRLEIKHGQGMYILGPINANDSFLEQNFNYENRNNGIGIGLDTDNFLVETVQNELNSVEKIHDVIRASLSVEKSLVENFGAL